MIKGDGKIEGITDTLLKFAYLDNSNFNIRILNNFSAYELFPCFKFLTAKFTPEINKVEMDNTLFFFPNGKLEEK